ncbi:MAG: hypothetical protein WDO16_18625 [Bacteroidota bacterium]
MMILLFEGRCFTRKTDHRCARSSFIATDYSAKAIENAKKNAIAAGVAQLIDFAVCDFAATEIPPGVPVFFM